MGFANRTEPADENSWNFRNKLDPSAQHFQIDVYKRQMEGWLDAVTEVSDISTTVGHKLDKDSPNCNL